MVDIDHTVLTRARLLWENACRQDGVTVVYSGTVVPGFESANAFDWRDFSLFRVEDGGVTTLDVTLTEAVTVNTFSAFMKPFLTAGGATIDLKFDTGAGFGASVAQGTVDENGLLNLETFTDVALSPGHKIRFEFNVPLGDDLLVRQLVVGPKMDLPMGQHNGIRPTTLTYGVVVDNTISVNGSILGRSQRRVEKMQELKQDYLEPEYIRDIWEPFAIHMVRYACIYQWSPVDYPVEVGFASAESIVAPENSFMRGKMMARMPLRTLTP